MKPWIALIIPAILVCGCNPRMSGYQDDDSEKRPYTLVKSSGFESQDSYQAVPYLDVEDRNLEAPSPEETESQEETLGVIFPDIPPPPAGDKLSNLDIPETEMGCTDNASDAQGGKVMLFNNGCDELSQQETTPYEELAPAAGQAAYLTPLIY